MESFINAWQQLPSQMSPSLFSIGSFQLRYYSLMYLVAFAIVYFLTLYRLKSENYEYTAETVQDYLVWAMLALILGGRFGYALFYNFGYYLQHPLEIILPFDFSNGIKFVGLSGMSYHGGLIGIVIATILFCRKSKINLWHFVDLFCPAIPLGYTFGRIGNFINGELYGRVTAVPWGMYFPPGFNSQAAPPFPALRSVLRRNCSFCYAVDDQKKEKALTDCFWEHIFAATVLCVSLSNFSVNPIINLV